MRNLSLLTFFLMSFFMFGQVGVNTTKPTATLDVNGNLRVRSVMEGTKSDSIVTISNGILRKTSQQIMKGGLVDIRQTRNNVRADMTINSSSMMKTYGTLLTENKLTIDPTDKNIVSKNGNLVQGNYVLSFNFRKSEKTTNKSSYLVVTFIDNKGVEADMSTIVFPDEWGTGVALPYNVNLYCPNQCQIRFSAMSERFSNEIKVEWTKLNYLNYGK